MLNALRQYIDEETSEMPQELLSAVRADGEGDQRLKKLTTHKDQTGHPRLSREPDSTP